MRVLVIGKGMFGTATARYLAPHAEVVLVGPDEPAEPARHHGVFASHYDEGRIVGHLAFDPLWIELVRRSLEGMRDLDGRLVHPCGVLMAFRTAGADFVEGVEALRDWLGIDLRRLEPATQRALFPVLDLDPDETLFLEGSGGHFSPRRYVALAEARAVELGATVVRRHAVRLERVARGVEAVLAGGSRVAGDAVVVATGSFTGCFDLLPRPAALRVKSETYLLAEVDPYDASLASLPCVVRELQDGDLADLYVLPPVAYPDGRVYLKAGANTLGDRWLDDLDAVCGWYRGGDGDAHLPALRRALDDLLPRTAIRSWHVRRCAESYTVHERPYVDVVEPGVVVAAGGNGRGAQVADAVGKLAADLVLDGDWSSDLPRDPFALVEAPGVWDRVTLLRERAAAHA